MSDHLIPDESYHIGGQYYGYRGDEIRFAEDIIIEGHSLGELLEQLFAHRDLQALLALRPTDLKLKLVLSGYRPMTRADQRQRDWARTESAQHPTGS